MGLDDMLIFAKVAEAQSFTGGARLLDMPKQTVSRRIAELERRLGVQLLVRTTRKVQVTEIGAAYFERCAQIMSQAEAAEREVAEAQETPRGLLRVTAPQLFGQAFLGPIIADYATRFPEVQIEVILMQQIADLVAENIDVAIRLGTLDESSLIARRLGPAETCYCASPAYLAARGAPETPADLRRHDCIALLFGAGPTRWPFLGPGGPLSEPISGRLRFTSFDMTYQAALAGLGIARIPTFACAQDLREGRLVTVLDGWTSREGSAYVVTPGGRHMSKKVRAFVDLVVQRFTAQQPWAVERPAPPTDRKR